VKRQLLEATAWRLKIRLERGGIKSKKAGTDDRCADGVCSDESDPISSGPYVQLVDR